MDDPVLHHSDYEDADDLLVKDINRELDERVRVNGNNADIRSMKIQQLKMILNLSKVTKKQEKAARKEKRNLGQEYVLPGGKVMQARSLRALLTARPSGVIPGADRRI